MKTKRFFLVAIVGGSGSGKSWLAEKLAVALGGEAVRLSLDDFYLDRSHLAPARRAQINFDHPRAIDWAAFGRVLTRLAEGRPAMAPRYDFATHARVTKMRVLEPKRFVIVDGLWLLRRRSVRRLFDFSVFIDCSGRVRLERRLARDLQGRGRAPASIRAQFKATVEPMHRRYVVPQSKFATVVLQDECGKMDVRRLAATVRDRLMPKN